ncbi:MAG: prepilin-type N-terminal cleavage/methylation domain-containing protein [Pirellulaceae bacterium]|nr:prepilin-type N-terminal cleavage/methylation domain-containing protein [Pirellulaceae bacterium]
MRTIGSRRRRGFTLLEVMIATAVTLLMMLSLVQVFKVVSDSMKLGRAGLQMNNTLRAVAFRLRHDLKNLTCRVDPPSDITAGDGYFEYIDGSMTDYTATLFDQNNVVDPTLPTQAVRSSRLGDCDDILMFTSRAGESWFTGRAPGNVVNTALTAAPITIASQLAEIVFFTRPVLSTAGAGGLFDDVDGNYLPDSYQLHYRVLLIRPDLNNDVFNGQPCLFNLSAGTPNTLADPLDMAPAFQLCDLSMRRVYDGNTATADGVAANSLEDLMNPANRFAHFQFSIPSSIAGTASYSTTLPLLVKQPIPNAGTVGNAITVFSDDGNAATVSPLLSDPNPAGVPGPLLGAAGNFLHPSFVLTGARLGEDVLATDVLAFDVKGYDAGVPVIGTAGADAVAAPLGADGSDDTILTPNDPGYAAAFSSGTIVSYGAYVDLLWGRKTICSLPYFGVALSSVAGTNLITELSGISSVAPSLQYSDGLMRSGKVIGSNLLAAANIVQPTFDTWSTHYESDGIQQAAFGGLGCVTEINGQNRLNAAASATTNVGAIVPTWRQGSIDAGADGIDNFGANGVDDSSELETLPPFPVQLRGIKVSIRIEDKATRQLRQMSVANEFVTQ